jgi:hypothetical protein
VSQSILPDPAESLVAQVESRFTRQFEQYLGQSVTQIQILPEEREILQDIEIQQFSLQVFLKEDNLNLTS